MSDTDVMHELAQMRDQEQVPADLMVEGARHLRWQPHRARVRLWLRKKSYRWWASDVAMAEPDPALPPILHPGTRREAR